MDKSQIGRAGELAIELLESRRIGVGRGGLEPPASAVIRAKR